MCTGTTTHMTCGHKLIHFTTRCRESNCTAVAGLHKKLNDTCACCHPSIVIAEINRRHDTLRESLMRQLREAPSRDQAQQIQRRIEEENAERGRELREAGKLKWEGFVDWGVPGEENEEMRGMIRPCESSDGKEKGKEK